MRQLIAALALAATGLLVAGCSSANHGISASTTSTTAPPVAVNALEGLLLSPAQINTAMGATGMTASGTYTTMGEFSADVSDKACLPMHNNADAAVYAGSAWSALVSSSLREPSDTYDHFVSQAVVLFPSGHDAGAFFTASAQSWPACSNRRYSVKPDEGWTVGQVSNTNGTLSATQTEEGHNGWNCQRALTVANNVAIDVSACSDIPSDVAINIAHQIAANVPTK